MLGNLQAAVSSKSASMSFAAVAASLQPGRIFPKAQNGYVQQRSVQEKPALVRASPASQQPHQEAELLALLPQVVVPHVLSELCQIQRGHRTAAVEPGPQDNNNSSTGYEPNDHFITEAYVEYTQEPLGEQRFPEDLDYDDVIIGQTLLNACGRRADHSEGEGLSSCLSSSVGRDRTGRPVVCLLVSSVPETQKLSWSDKESRFSLTVKRRFENTNSRPITSCSSRRRTTPTRSTKLLHEEVLKQNLDLREAHEKSLNDMEELKRFQGSTVDTVARRKSGRRSRYYP